MFYRARVSALTCLFFAAAPFLAAQIVTIKPSALPAVGTVDERFQSYNVEMVEVTGGRFWRPFDAKTDALLAEAKNKKTSTSPAGLDPALFMYRSPIELSNTRLRKLATALGPAYIRVSGTWQNSTYFQDSDAPAPAKPPEGFGSVLTRQRWKEVVDFSHTADAKIISSFATSMGTRDASGAWTTTMAEKWLAYNKSIGGSIAAAEYMNEPSFPSAAGVPAGYDGAAFARDVKLWKEMMQRVSPETKQLGPGSVGEGTALSSSSMKLLSSEEMLKATGPVFDAFSYHFYGAVSERCTAGAGIPMGITADKALTHEWLTRTGKVEEFYGNLRDRYLPGKKLWLTETAEAACGGDRWAAAFVDTFRYLNQLGTLARRGVQIVAHNTLASSDYGLLDESTFEPRPDYWAAWMWRRFMGSTVLDAGNAPSEDVYLYAHCLRKAPGGVALLAINAAASPAEITLASNAKLYAMTSPSLDSKVVLVNGKELKLGAADALPTIQGVAVKAGQVSVASHSIAFITVHGAHNSACMKQ